MTDLSEMVTVAPLEKGSIEQAFPLVQAVASNLTIERWARIAAPLTTAGCSDRQGILAAMAAAGYLCGLCLYRVEQGAGRKRLVARYVVTFDVTDRAPVAAALVAAIDRLAARLGCGTVNSSVAAAQLRLVAHLHAAGHQPTRMLLCKDLQGGGVLAAGACAASDWLDPWGMDGSGGFSGAKR